MSGLYPNPSGGAETYKVGDQVKWFTSEKSISPYVGEVTEVCPGINKVWVDFPIGGNQQKDPSELILITPFVGTTPVAEESGYDSYDKTVSNENYGTVQDKVKKMAKSMASKEAYELKVSKMASKVAGNFAEKVVTKLAADVVSCLNKGMTDIQAYQNLYPQYENTCSDGFMRSAISKIYKTKEAMQGTIADIGKYDNFDDYLKNLKTWLGVDKLSEDRIKEEKRRFDEFKKKNPGK
jgi:hypothetical protein